MAPLCDVDPAPPMPAFRPSHSVMLGAALRNRRFPRQPVRRPSERVISRSTGADRSMAPGSPASLWGRALGEAGAKE
jgi:hypothetical protein